MPRQPTPPDPTPPGAPRPPRVPGAPRGERPPPRAAPRRGTDARGRPVRAPDGRRGARAARPGARAYRQAADRRLRAFRQATALTVALTGLALLLVGAPDAPAQDPAPPTATAAPAVVDTVALDTVAVDTVAVDTVVVDSADVAAATARSVEEATGTIRQLARGVTAVAPKLLIALGVLVLAGLLARLVRPTLRALLRSFDRAEAISALAVIGLWLVALSAALSIVAGDARALLGSVGLLGLALSWALQAPIESFSGWLLNSFRGYYRVGDRILVGDVFGDVARIDFLTTTVWEAGGPGKPVQGAQPTGALVTFPNSDVLRSNITNYTRDFPYVWDEVSVGLANESDLEYALGVLEGVAERTVGEVMAAPAREYIALARASGLPLEIAERPQLFVSPTDAWVDVVIRYLVPVRERRRWATALHRAVAVETARPEHAGRIVGAYPTARVRLEEARG